jgi:hypothetical protein
MGVPKKNRKKTGFEHWQEAQDQAHSDADDRAPVLVQSVPLQARALSPAVRGRRMSASRLSLTSAFAV